MKRILGLLVSTCLVWQAQSQNYPLYNSYITNPFLLNPAEAASGKLDIFANYRNQWVGMSGAPTLATIGARTLLHETRAAVGFKASSFKRGILTSTDANFTFAYGVPLDKKNKLFFGLSGGLLSNSVNWNLVTDVDPLLTSMSGMLPSMAFGALLKNSSGLNVGLVLPQLFKTESFVANNFAIAPQDNIMVTAYYSNWHPALKKTSSHNKSKRSSKNSKSKGSPLEVFSVFRYSTLGLLAEGGIKYNFQSSLWLSANYRKISGIIPGLGLNMGSISLAYFYETGVGGDFPLKTHEVAFNIRLGEEKVFKEQKGTKPVKPPAPIPNRPRVPVAAPKVSENTPKTPTDKPETTPTTTPAANRPRNSGTPAITLPPTTNPVVQPPATNPVVTNNPPATNPVVQPPVTNPVVTTNPPATNPVVQPPVTNPVIEQPATNPVANNQPVTEPTNPRLDRPEKFASKDDSVQHHEEVDKLNRLSEHADDPTEEHAEEGHAHAERHEFHARGNHAKELEVGGYVIVGAFRSEPNAKHFADELKKLGFSEVNFGYLSAKSVWYIYITSFENTDEGKTKRNKFRKMKMFKDAWLLTVTS